MTADEKRKLVAGACGEVDPRIRSVYERIARAGDVLLAEIERLKAEIARLRAQGSKRDRHG